MCQSERPYVHNVKGKDVISHWWGRKNQKLYGNI